jgi:ABC-2 type transport system permease protein
MFTPFRLLFKGALRDRVSLLWAVAFPLVFLVVLGFIFPTHAYRQQLLLGMLALSVLFFGLQGIAFESLYQRNRGVYKLLRATPYRITAFVAHLTLARGLVALICGALVVLLGMLIFNLWFRWETVLLFLPPLVLATLCFTFLGLIVSNLSQNETQVSMINNIVTLPMLFASEVFYNLHSAPGWIMIVGHIFPLSYLIDAEKAALAVNVSGVAFSTLILLAMTLLTLLLAVATFRWDADASPLHRFRSVPAIS